MAVRRFSALTGLVFLLLSLTGFISPRLLGLLQLDMVHRIMYLVVGVLGLLAASHEGYSLRFSQVIGVFYLALAVLGVFTGSLFGMLHGDLPDHVLHFLTGAIALYFGFVVAAEAEPARRGRVQ
ncbi:hypothetical protein DNH61_14895 [Paenibacillus sambharensis]|uniref:DUF4383 domain-containing protein n=1 Tax=Paenibacillus sambharensis TaxID=1803190 RepID=A0A2W1L4G3_9BACL|nr:DUF4383 domain-containing protein [Paenibacillus sambharensis]PZD94928.1 hypothetical protein DNH61_14895 [Paenibacillus sambharensis]